jgi:ribonuclease/clavin/mitogillin
VSFTDTFVHYSLLLLSNFVFRRLLLDTSEPNKKDYIDLLEQVLKEESASISDIIISHWHDDHIGGLEDIRARKLVDDSCRVWKFPRNDAPENFETLGLLKLTDEQTFDVGGDIYKIYFTPGHTTDHAILFNAEKKTVFSADCILGEGTAVFEDLYDYMQSLEKILALKPELIYPGHGNIVPDAVQKIEYYIAHRQERERQIVAALTAADRLTLMGIVEIVYKETPKELWKAAAFNVHHHLTKLKKEGKVVEIDEDGDEVYWQMSHINKL